MAFPSVDFSSLVLENDCQGCDCSPAQTVTLKAHFTAVQGLFSAVVPIGAIYAAPLMGARS